MLLKEHGAVDEQARDNERTICGTECGADPAPCAEEARPSSQANAQAADAQGEAPPRGTSHPPLLPRAAGGGAGAVAALVHGESGAPDLRLRPRPELSGAAGGEEGGQ